MTELNWLTQWPDTSHNQSNPFVSDAFLQALETSDVCSKANGWQPNHLKTSEGIVIPAYLKHNSWGEYVFDWSWASAYEQHGLDYYPKLLVACPFTPSMGPRLLGVSQQNQAADVIGALKEQCLEKQLSGFHILFPNKNDQELLNSLSLLQRTDIQYHWQNRGYHSFEDFLCSFKSRKRKNVRKERKAIKDQGIEIKTIQGQQISAQELEHFYHFYQATYLKRGRQGYLNRTFFNLAVKTMPENIVLFLAYKGDQPVAGALCFQDDSTLYGRYWGCLEEYYNLHFETCYYHGIDYCIETGRVKFDPGTQGEHKISRGFEPVLTKSYHWLAHEGFHEAAKEFCKTEQKYTEQFQKEVLQSLPFKCL